MKYLNISKLKSLFLILLVLAGCGGGGSGGEGGTVSTGVRMLHASIEASPVTLSSSVSEEYYATGRFSLAAPYINLPTGEQVLSIRSAKSEGSDLFLLELNLERNKRHSALLFGSLENGLQANLFEDYSDRVNENEIAIRVVHGIAGASQIKASFGETEIAESVDYGSASDYTFLPYDSGELLIRRQADSRIVYAAFQEFAPGRAYTILASGEVDYLVLAPVYQDN